MVRSHPTPTRQRAFVCVCARGRARAREPSPHPAPRDGGGTPPDFREAPLDYTGPIPECTWEEAILAATKVNDEDGQEQKHTPLMDPLLCKNNNEQARQRPPHQRRRDAPTGQEP